MAVATVNFLDYQESSDWNEDLSKKGENAQNDSARCFLKHRNYEVIM